jgi:soluble P-type ATPase
MINIEIPGWGKFPVGHLVLDLNGTFSLDGRIIQGVKRRMNHIAEKLDIHILTADTFGQAVEICSELPVTLHIIQEENQVEAKRKYLSELPLNCIAVGNGRNDAGMLADATIGIVVIGPEGASSEAVRAADAVVTNINDALDLVIYPERLKATLRS